MKKTIVLVLLSLLGAVLTAETDETKGWRSPYAMTLPWVIPGVLWNGIRDPGAAATLGADQDGEQAMYVLVPLPEDVRGVGATHLHNGDILSADGHHGDGEDWCKPLIVYH